MPRLFISFHESFVIISKMFYIFLVFVPLSIASILLSSLVKTRISFTVNFSFNGIWKLLKASLVVILVRVVRGLVEHAVVIRVERPNCFDVLRRLIIFFESRVFLVVFINVLKTLSLKVFIFSLHRWPFFVLLLFQSEISKLGLP